MMSCGILYLTISGLNIELGFVLHIVSTNTLLHNFSHQYSVFIGNSTMILLNKCPFTILPNAV